MTVPISPYFKAPGIDVLVVTPLDTLAAVYDRRSGLTHLVAEPIPAILDALSAGPTDLAGLVRRLDALYAIDGDACALAARLGEMTELGMIEARNR